MATIAKLENEPLKKGVAPIPNEPQLHNGFVTTLYKILQ